VPFPYDLTQEALDYSNKFARDHSTLAIQHYDDCIPWQEMLDEQAPPQWMLDQWHSAKTYIPDGKPVYIAITPTKQDRHTLAHGCGDAEGEIIDPPESLLNAGFDSPETLQAWQRYVEYVVQFFEPDYLNIGIEINSLLWLYPDDWPAMEQFLLSSYHSTKISHPQIRVGVEAILQNLMLDPVASGFQKVADEVDFLGISFYPYTSAFFEVYGMPPAKAPPLQWQEPLSWLSNYTNTPLAIAETGYTTETNTVDLGDGLVFPGDTQLQQSFLKDLQQFARWDEYLFVIWFVPIDYDLLSLTVGEDIGVDAPIWEDSGLIEFDLTPKPAFEDWLEWPQFSLNKRSSGSWYTRGQSGHGYSMHFLDWNRLIIYWFTYDNDGQQIWLLGDGEIQQNKAQLKLIKTEGMHFGTFIESDVQMQQWGTMQIEFSQCDKAILSWQTAQPGFVDGSLPIEQIAPVAGLACAWGATLSVVR